MQLKISLAAATLISAMTAQGEDYVSIQYLQYNENQSRTAVSAPSLMINKDFGADYTLNASIVLDAVSGASETWYDASSGASVYSRGEGVPEYGNIKYDEMRTSGGMSLTTRFDNRDELTVGFNYSGEYDFRSREASAEYMHWLDRAKNSSISFGLSYQDNDILVRCPPGTGDTCDANSGASTVMNAEAINTQLSYFQNINAKSYFQASLFYIEDDGFLSSPYSNVVRNYDETTNTGDIVSEIRPDKRTAYGTSLKYATVLASDITTHINYRYYTDDWDIDSHTIDTDIFYELSNDWLLNFGLRYYMQSEANFYNESKDYFTSQEYASSDKRLSDFNALTYKLGVDYAVSDSLNVNFSANYYDQSTDLSATYFITGLTYKF